MMRQPITSSHSQTAWSGPLTRPFYNSSDYCGCCYATTRVMLLRVLPYGITALFFLGGGTNYSGPSGTFGAVSVNYGSFFHSCRGATIIRATASANGTAVHNPKYRPLLSSVGAFAFGRYATAALTGGTFSASSRFFASTFPNSFLFAASIYCA